MKCVKMLLLGSALAVCFSTAAASAQNAVTAPTAVAAQAPAPVAAPLPVVTVDEPTAPPQWAQNLLVTAEKLPVVGPFVSKALVYMGVLVSVLTAGIAFLLTILSTLSGIAGLAGLADFAAKIQAFKGGKIMYWLKFLSMFNAQAPAVPVVSIASAPSDEQKSAA